MNTAAPAAMAAPTLRPVPWMASLRAETAWDFALVRSSFASLLIVQLLAGAGLIVGFGLFFHHIPRGAALYVCTGVPVVNLAFQTVVMTPQSLSQMKAEQSYDYMMSLPVRAFVRIIAWGAVMGLMGAPPVVVTLLVGAWRYGLTYHLNLLLAPALLLVLVSGTLIGMAIGHFFRRPAVIQNVTQIIVFAVFGLSPVVFPASHLPGWLADINRGLPFEYMADLCRAGLTNGLVNNLGVAFAVTCAWAGVGWAVAVRAMGRRD